MGSKWGIKRGQIVPITGKMEISGYKVAHNILKIMTIKNGDAPSIKSSFGALWCQSGDQNGSKLTKIIFRSYHDHRFL